MTERKPLMQITIFNEPGFPCRVQSFEGSPKEPITPRMLILGVACAMEEFFVDAAQAGEIEYHSTKLN